MPSLEPIRANPTTDRARRRAMIDPPAPQQSQTTECSSGQNLVALIRVTIAKIFFDIGEWLEPEWAKESLLLSIEERLRQKLGAKWSAEGSRLDVRMADHSVEQPHRHRGDARWAVPPSRLDFGDDEYEVAD